MISKKAASVMETVILVAVLTGALLLMQAYIRGTFAGKLKDQAVSSLGAPFDPRTGTFISESYSEGDIAFVNRLETIDGQSPDPEDNSALYAVGYQVIGPESYENEDGEVVIEGSSDRRAFRSSTYTSSGMEL